MKKSVLLLVLLLVIQLCGCSLVPVGTRTSDLHIRQPLGKLIMRRHPLAVRGSTAQNLVEELLYAAVKRGRRQQDWASALEAAVACGCMMDAVLNYPPRWENQDGK